jgi:N-acetylneuraminic acid mutarotase
MEPALPVALEESTESVAGGKLYLIGGFDAVGNSLSSVYVFDGAAWSAGPRLPLGVDHTASASLDDHVYVAGGHSFGRDSRRVFRLDGASWVEVASMNHARGGHTLLAYGGRLYAIGGNIGAATNVAVAEVYDPQTNQWTDLPALPAPRNHVAGFVYGPYLCAAGGRSPNTARVDCFDVENQGWVRLPDLPGPTSGAGSATLENGDVVVMGGQDAGESKIIDQFARLPVSNQWTLGAPMLVPRHGFGLAVFQGRAWACGGGNLAGLHPVATCTSVL